MVVGWTHAGNFCYVPVALAGAPCSALVDTGSTATLMRPDMVPVGTQLEQTSVQLRTVTGELAPMLGRGKVVITVGGLSVELRVWVAEVQDSCILGQLTSPAGSTPLSPSAAPFTPSAPFPGAAKHGGRGRQASGYLSLPFVLDTDASNVGMGAVLSQVGPEGERAVAYFSHTFNKAERNYCVTRRELLAVVKAVRHFSHRTPRTLSVPEQQQQPVDLTGATRPRRRRRPPGRFEDFV
ncbi:hypothetical protein AAFF_G00375210 [Aldrovandia affinis]|uniref:Reverse transcriptase/retrotransposon-derived protein RNase H-like domain-containing protein n=1 Tax=Aldrovandia affinis TaxID=143900 RepID=A0AAD7WMB0_9TELE|nr:hypothetical protein AAFF_G00375210 [Aldrovandia affinis]